MENNNSNSNNNNNKFSNNSNNNMNNNSLIRNKLKVIPLGGVEEIGFNSTIFEYKDMIFIIDFGLGFPNGDLYGVEYLIPNLEYLKKNKNNIKGIIITHGHLDHIGGLKYALKALGDIPVFASEFTLEMIKNNLSIKGDSKQFNIITQDSKLNFSEVGFEFFHINHSIPQSLGVVMRTPIGNIVHTGDFKFDNSPLLEPVADYGKIARIGTHGVLALLSDSTNSFRSGHSKSEQQIKDSLYRLIESAKGRVIVASFASLVGRMIQLIDIAQKQNRKVAIAGRSMIRNLDVAKKFGYIKGLEKTLFPLQQIETLPDNKVMVLATGSQGEEMAALSRIIKNKHPDLSIKKGDTVILSSSIIPGNDIYVQNLLDDLSRLGAIVYQQAEDIDTHTSGHGYQEDQKLMLNLVKPKYFMPVHGYQSFLYKHAQTAINTGFDEKNVIVPIRGEVISFSDNGTFTRSKPIKNTPVLISGSGVGDIGSIVLSERQQLGNNGVIIFSASINRSENKIVTHPQLLSKGLTYVRDNPQLFEQLNVIATQTLTAALDDKVDHKELMNLIKQKLSSVVLKELNRDPMILVLLNYLN